MSSSSIALAMRRWTCSVMWPVSNKWDERRAPKQAEARSRHTVPKVARVGTFAIPERALYRELWEDEHMRYTHPVVFVNPNSPALSRTRANHAFASNPSTATSGCAAAKLRTRAASAAL